jgi:hypothetical protein
MYRFWYDLSADGVMAYLGSEGSGVEISPAKLNPIFERQVVIVKRELPYGEVSASGLVHIGGELLGRIARDPDGLNVFQDGQKVGAVDLQGNILRDGLFLGRISQDGGITDAQGNDIGSIDQTRGSILFDCGSEWGWVVVDDSKILPWVNQVTAAFLFFFTELPHAMQKFDCDQ